MPNFEVDFLDDYTDESLLSEIRRVSAQVSSGRLSSREFVRLSRRVSISTIRRRFGSWQGALSKAGLGHLYSGQKVSDKMKRQLARQMSDSDLIAELRRVYTIVGAGTMNRKQFNTHSNISYEAIRRRFGWHKALKIAGITPSLGGGRQKWTTEQCFENLAKVWVHYGRSPYMSEMSTAPSTVHARVYVGRWGTWRRALRAFIHWANSEAEALPTESLPRRVSSMTGDATSHKTPSFEDKRQVGQRLRFRVLQRDNFKCVACGRSPANQIGIFLHVDHIVPVAAGGRTTIDNLQTLCQNCNLGKGTLSDRSKN
ncbi:MAG: HNH endonuclease [Candidatus Acidiferrales bacterium]